MESSVHALSSALISSKIQWCGKKENMQIFLAQKKFL